MGMFDTVIFNCPNCGGEVDTQSKAGERLLRKYLSNVVPLEIACDISGSQVKCYHCNSQYIIRFETPPTPPRTHRMKLSNIDMVMNGASQEKPNSSNTDD